MPTRILTTKLLSLGLAAALPLSSGVSVAFQSPQAHVTSQAQQSPPVQPAPQAQQGQRELQPGEARIAREVRHQLLLLPYYTIFDWFTFNIDVDTVTLNGEVVWPVLKSDAGNVVKHIEGVRKVVNNIKVLPVSNFDDQTRRAEFRAIYGNPALRDRYGFQAYPPIHIIVDNGHVTLKGVVANAFDKNIAGVQANTVPNVFSVDNQLQIEQASHGK